MALIAATPEAITRAGAALRAGRLVAFPTETVYGLGADATNPSAVAAIFAAKGRPRFNPLIVHVPDWDEVRRLGAMQAEGERLGRAFWPGPLTLVMKRTPDCPVCDLATAGLDTIALRIPAHPVAQALLRAARVPIAAPSANRSGHVSPTTAAHVDADLGDLADCILDAGPTAVGLESTVIDVSGKEPVVLRLGGIAREGVAQVLGRRVAVATGEPGAPASPGMLDRHYAPRARLRLDARDVRPGEALLAFGPDPAAHSGPMINLSPAGDLVEAAAHLFASLRALDASGVAAIAVAPIPEQGLGEAINDRLRRAARGAEISGLPE